MQLYCANIECGKKDKIFNIDGMTEQQINEIESRFPRGEWVLVRREV